MTRLEFKSLGDLLDYISRETILAESNNGDWHRIYGKEVELLLKE